mmetsp:Transcript_14154/g.40117  ORF Transcript_14154/g.40117 Transcript_14154/m.40117 type:complete len:223 (-) Transcript_14154:392-1060(-)
MDWPPGRVPSRDVDALGGRGVLQLLQQSGQRAVVRVCGKIAVLAVVLGHILVQHPTVHESLHVLLCYSRAGGVLPGLHVLHHLLGGLLVQLHEVRELSLGILGLCLSGLAQGLEAGSRGPGGDEHQQVEELPERHESPQLYPLPRHKDSPERVLRSLHLALFPRSSSCWRGCRCCPLKRGILNRCGCLLGCRPLTGARHLGKAEASVPPGGPHQSATPQHHG